MDEIENKIENENLDLETKIENVEVTEQLEPEEQPMIEEPACECVPVEENPEPKKKKCCCNCWGITAFAISIVALVLAVLLVVKPDIFKCGKEPLPEETIFDEPITDQDSALDIAYIDLDTLLLTYNYAVKLQEDLLMEQKKAESSIDAKMKALEEKYNAFMEKERAGLFLSAASRESQQNAIVQEQQNIEALQTTLTNKLLEKQAAMNAEIYDSVVNFVNQYCKGRYSLILGNTSGSIVVYSRPGMNITNDVVVKLNQRYGGSPSNEQ